MISYAECEKACETFLETCRLQLTSRQVIDALSDEAVELTADDQQQSKKTTALDEKDAEQVRTQSLRSTGERHELVCVGRRFFLPYSKWTKPRPSVLNDTC
jgi:hypothetical protein